MYQATLKGSPYTLVPGFGPMYHQSSGLHLRSDRHRVQQPVVKVWLHSTGEASPLHSNAAAALGTPGLAALLLLQILPVMPPHRANDTRRGPRFSVVAPCHRRASPVSVRRQTFTTGC